MVIAPYVSFCAVIIAPVFDDFQDAPSIRYVILAIFTCVMTLTFVMASNNPDVITRLLFATPFTYCLESAGRSVWSIIRKFEPCEFN